MNDRIEVLIENLLNDASNEQLSYSDVKYIAEEILRRASHRNVIIQKPQQDTSSQD